MGRLLPAAAACSTNRWHRSRARAVSCTTAMHRLWPEFTRKSSVAWVRVAAM